MSNESYFAQYVSPNIVIVPTISFISPSKRNKPDVNLSSKSENNHNTSTSSPNCVYKDISKEACCNIACTGTPDYHQEEQTDNMNQSQQQQHQPPPNIYKSKNNLVDLTGFNMSKRDIPVKKKFDSGQMKVSEIKDSKDKKEFKNLNSNTHTKDNNSNRDSSKSDRTLDNCKENVKDRANSESKQDQTDMEDKMKKYFRHLWTRNLEKLKDISDKALQSRQSLKTKQNCQDSKSGPSKNSKEKIAVTAKGPTTKSSKKKPIDSSNGHHDHDKLVTKNSNRSKSELKSSFHHIKDRKRHLSPDPITRSEKKQRFIRHSENSDNDSKYNADKQNKTDNSHSTFLKSNKTTIYHAESKRLVERKLFIKSDLHSNKNQNNKDNKLVKSVVTQVNKKMPNDYTQSECDLRSRLSRKRTRSECPTYAKQVMENKMDTTDKMEDLVITVKQDVKMDPKILSPKNKPKTKRCKKIKLVINIECPTSDSEDTDQNINECCTSPQDLSFLDDFDVDEIVDSLNANHSLSEDSKNAIEMSYQINKTNENDQIVKLHRETNTKARLIKTTNMKVNNFKENTHVELIDISDISDDDDVSEIVNVSPGSKCSMLNKTQDDKISKKGAEKSDQFLTAYKDTNHKNRESSVTAIKKLLNVVSQPNHKNIDNLKDKNILTNTNTNQIKILPIRSQKPVVGIQNQLSTVNSVSNLNIGKTIKSSHVNTSGAEIYCIDSSNDSIEESLATIFIDSEQEFLEKSESVRFNMFNLIKQNNEKQLNLTKNKYTVEASLDNMFNDVKDETIFNVDTTLKGACQNIKRDKTIPTTQESTEVAVETTRNIFDQKANDEIKITLENNEGNRVKIEPEKAKEALEAPMGLEMSQNNIKRYVSTNMYKYSDVHNREHLSNLDTIDTNKKSLDIPINITKNHDIVKIHTKVHEPDNSIKTIKDIHLQAAKYISTKPLEILKNSNTNEHMNRISQGNSENTKDTTKNYLKKSSIKSENKAEQRNNKEKHYLMTEQRFKRPSVTENNIVESYVERQVGIPTSSESNKNINFEHNVNESINLKATTNFAENKFTKMTEPLNKLNSITKTATAAVNSDITTNDVDIKTEIRSPSNSTNKNVTEPTNLLQKSDIKEKAASLNNPTNTDIKILRETINYGKENHRDDIDIETPNKHNIDIKEKTSPVQILTSKNNIIKEKSNNKIEINHQNESNKTINENLKHDTTNNCLKTTIDNDEQITPNISVKKTENNVNNLQQFELKTNDDMKHHLTINDKLRSNLQADTLLEKSEVTTTKSTSSVDLKIDSKAIETEATSNTKEKHEESQENITNNDQQLRTIHTDSPKDKKPREKCIEEDDNPNKCDENKKADSKIKQKVNSYDTSVSNGGAQSNLNAKKEDTKFDKVRYQFPSEFQPFVKKLEYRMFNYFGEKYTVTSLINNGRFSDIYKCKDVKGKIYALKVVDNIQFKDKGVRMEKMLTELQKCGSTKYSCNAYLINTFGMQGFWCLLTYYYPKNLQEALVENGRSFPLEVVQVLAKQLVDAVIMLSDNNIIHSDIKPNHILLNSKNDRLKLCGFDRADYSYRININPSFGTASYRAPEIILGFPADQKLDVWSTALVIFEMATNIRLFPGTFNNQILYKQICTLGSFDWEMIENCKFKKKHFNDISFLRRVGAYGERTIIINAFHRNNKLRDQLFGSAWSLHKMDGTDEEKLGELHSLLEQMLILHPRRRLPIQFVGSSQFLKNVFI